VTLESRGGPTPFHYRYFIAPKGTGTRLSMTGDISSAGLPWPFGFGDAITTRAFKDGMRQNLDVLKRLVESDAA
jgi:hypothetical protein